MTLKLNTIVMHKFLKSFRLLNILHSENQCHRTLQCIPFITQIERRNYCSSSGYDEEDSESKEFNRVPPRFNSRQKYMNNDPFGEKRSMRKRPHRYQAFEDDNFDHGGTLQRKGNGLLGAALKTHDWNSKELGSFEKNFFISHPSVSERSQEETDAFYQKYNISIGVGEKPTPICHFREANFPDKIIDCLKRTGWSEPTPIQSIGWPLALSGKNLVGIAQTGSGKTLGFILPALVHIRHQRPVQKGEGPVVVVLAPTRELAQQIQGVADEFCKPMGIRSCCVFGGQSKLIQAKSLMKGQELIVATPGRLIDFLEDEVISLERTTYVVLDEADRMLDMGFEPQIRKILGQIRPDRQILMWTATWPEEIQSLARDFLGDFTQINIGSTELTVNPNIKQIVKVCEERDKFRRLLDELESIRQANEDHKLDKTLIFVNTQMRAETIVHRLRNTRTYAKEIHGRKSQAYRDATLESFRKGQLKVLVATDVAARGLDVNDIKVVINYDYPNCIDDYIHRIGRTARATKSGTAVSFFTDSDASKLSDLVHTLQRTGQDIDPELKELLFLNSKYSKKASRKFSPRFGNRRDSWLPNHRQRYGRRSEWQD